MFSNGPCCGFWNNPTVFPLFTRGLTNHVPHARILSFEAKHSYFVYSLFHFIAQKVFLNSCSKSTNNHLQQDCRPSHSIIPQLHMQGYFPGIGHLTFVEATCIISIYNNSKILLAHTNSHCLLGSSTKSRGRF